MGEYANNESLVNSIVDADRLTYAQQQAVAEIKSDLDELDEAADKLLESQLEKDELKIFSELVMSVNSRIKVSSLDNNVKNQLRSALCEKARKTVSATRTGASRGPVSKYLTCLLTDQFGDLDEWAGKLKEDADALDRENPDLAYTSVYNYRQFMDRYAGPKAQQERSRKKAVILIWILILLAVGITAAVLIPRLFPGKEPEPEETVYSAESQSGDHVYADIVRITPAYAVTTSGVTGITQTQSFSSSSLLCDCVTEKGERVWAYILYSTYRSKIDPSIIKEGQESSPLFIADPKELSPPVRIHGGIVSGYALALMVKNGGEKLSSVVGDRPVIFCSSAEEPAAQ